MTTEQLAATVDALRAENVELRSALEGAKRFVMSFAIRPVVRPIQGEISDPDRPRREAVETMAKIKAALSANSRYLTPRKE